MLVTDSNTGNIYVMNVSETHPSTKRYILFLCTGKTGTCIAAERDAAAEEGGG